MGDAQLEAFLKDTGAEEIHEHSVDGYACALIHRWQAVQETNDVMSIEECIGYALLGAWIA